MVSLGISSQSSVVDVTTHDVPEVLAVGDTLHLQPAVYVLTPEGPKGPCGFLMGLRGLILAPQDASIMWRSRRPLFADHSSVEHLEITWSSEESGSTGRS